MTKLIILKLVQFVEPDDVVETISVSNIMFTQTYIVAKLEQLKGWCICLVGVYACIKNGAYVMKFKPKLLFLKI